MPKPKTITIDGETKTISEWSAVSGIPRTTIARRIERGMDAKKAVFDKPVSLSVAGRRGRKKSPMKGMLF